MDTTQCDRVSEPKRQRWASGRSAPRRDQTMSRHRRERTPSHLDRRNSQESTPPRRSNRQRAGGHRTSISQKVCLPRSDDSSSALDWAKPQQRGGHRRSDWRQGRGALGETKAGTPCRGLWHSTGWRALGAEEFGVAALKELATARRTRESMRRHDDAQSGIELA